MFTEEAIGWERSHLHKSGDGRYREGRREGLPDKNCGLYGGKLQPIQDDLAGR